MAEIIGTVAALVQLIDTVKRAAELWEEIQKASEIEKQARSTIDNLEVALLYVQECYALFPTQKQAHVKKVLDTITSKLQSISDEITKCAASKSKLAVKFKLVRHRSAIIHAFEDIEREKRSLDMMNNSIVGNMLLNQIGDFNKVQKLLSQRMISVNDCSDDGISYMHMAAAFGWVDILKIMIHEGADPEARDSDSRTALDVLHEYAPQALDCDEDRAEEPTPHSGRSSKELLEGFMVCCRFLESKGCSSGESFDILGASGTSLSFNTAALEWVDTDNFLNVKKWGRFISNIGVDINEFYGADFNALIAQCRAFHPNTNKVPIDYYDIDRAPDRVALLLALGADVHVACFDGMQPMHHLFSTASSSYLDRSYLFEL
ncbi:hypothetical protein G7Z17_g4982 [Cylindrodendrum hubeiense]|uniref:Uncharacterized protein n=1 Tax=Cylindrodendrum hubeiense TaxID=595255 RepID=A0A9P5LHS9_9HYPO|nr:hypothetical protein G7Z17_g4982 [Cylindrodendrum hubeiense]